MIEIRYSAPDNLDISGTAGDFQNLERIIRDLISSSGSRVAINTDSAIDPAPYTFAIPKLVVLKAEGPTQVSLLDNDELSIRGSPENLESLATFFHFDKDAVKGVHFHYEYYDGNRWIDPKSIPLVISVR